MAKLISMWWFTVLLRYNNRKWICCYFRFDYVYHHLSSL